MAAPYGHASSGAPIAVRLDRAATVTAVNDRYPRPRDVAVLGLEFESDPTRSHFELVPNVARHDGTLYGGTAIAASVAAMETATERPILWATTQYVATAQQGDIVECTTEVLAHGRNISQVSVQGRHQGRLLFLSIGSTAVPRDGGFEGQFQSMPTLAGPGDSLPLNFGMPDGFLGFTAQVEYREARTLDADPAAPPLALWSRLSGGASFTPATIAFVADMVPGGIARSVGMVGGGASLDNSLRFGSIPDDIEWVLLELRGHMAHGAHAHGSVSVWSAEGHLLAVGGQSANMSHMVPVREAQRLQSESR
jgi:acyl-CoA thioesterase